MNIKHLTATVASVAAFSLSAISAEQIYSGEPYAEALPDLTRNATLVSHELSSASPLLRTDVFRLSDGRLVAITSRAKKLGQPCTIEALRLAPTATSRLTKRLPPLESIEIPK